MFNARQPRESKMKKVLMIAHVFPPFRSVGHSIRVVKFIKYLPALGWLPVVLTIDDQMEYGDYLKQGSESLLSDIPQEVSINRTIAGEPSLEFLEKEERYGHRNWFSAVIAKVLGGARRWIFRNLLLPDPHVAWLPFALWRGRQIVRKEGIDVIFATCPPHSATLIGACLKRLTGKPLVLDFRDDWIDTPWHHSRSKIIRMIERKMESWVIKEADKVILVTEFSRNAFLKRYPKQPSEKFVFISNGVDLGEFDFLNSMPAQPRTPNFTILHAGSLNDSKFWTRTPTALFKAIQRIQQQRPDLVKNFTLAFTGRLPERQMSLVKEMGLINVVKELGFLSHDDLLRFMKRSEALLVINYEGFATLIPGKIYEYWAVGGPPILLLSCPGAASSLVEKYNLGIAVDFDDITGIEQAIMAVYDQSKSATPLRLNTSGIEAFDRKALSCKLAEIFSNLSNGQ